jgi:hypothetical protein
MVLRRQSGSGESYLSVHEGDGLDGSELGQGQAASFCRLAKRTLDAAESRYAQSWLLARQLAPTAMMTGGDYRLHTLHTPSFFMNIVPSKTVTPLTYRQQRR